MKCDICGCEHNEKIMLKVGLLHLKGSEDDYICPRCQYEISTFARSLQAVVNKVRLERNLINKLREK